MEEFQNLKFEIQFAQNFLLPAFHATKAQRVLLLIHHLIHSKEQTNILRSDKITIPLEESLGVVHAAKCDCGATYTGETGTSITYRFMEHMKCLARYLNAKSRTKGAQTRPRGRPQILEPSVIMNQGVCIRHYEPRETVLLTLAGKYGSKQPLRMILNTDVLLILHVYCMLRQAPLITLVRIGLHAHQVKA
uniref:Uncharacterized protein n=1 Tax=Trichuris muris TaxID=70415 RepID=A0A5S6Q156_TRIMR